MIGVLLSILAAAMLVPTAVDLAFGHSDWVVFLTAAAITLFVGVAMILSSRGGAMEIQTRQAFILTALSWVVIAAFAALPFAFSELNLSYTDAFFESMSGVTTTGSTVIVGLDDAPPGILLWRAILQWLGGIGIIVMALSVLPMLRVGGMQLFRLESSDTSEKALPRAAQLATSIALIYVGITAACASTYGLFGMSWLDSIAHAMTTIATGGFSTSDLSIGHYGSPQIEASATVYMFLGGLPFVLYLKALRGRPQDLVRDGQVQWFFWIVVAAIAAMTAYLLVQRDDLAFMTAVRLTAFNTVSVITGTGYATSDYGVWGAFATTGFFYLMFIGGCAGSTSCGIKIFRFQVLYATCRSVMGKLVHPSGVYIAYYNRKPIPESVSESVMAFFFLFAFSFAGLALGLSLLGLDYLTSVSGAATAIANVGPGLGPIIGPAGTFEPLPDAAKWLLSFGMLLGRLELFTVLILIFPAFWRG